MLYWVTRSTLHFNMKSMCHLFSVRTSIWGSLRFITCFNMPHFSLFKLPRPSRLEKALTKIRPSGQTHRRTLSALFLDLYYWDMDSRLDEIMEQFVWKRRRRRICSGLNNINDSLLIQFKIQECICKSLKRFKSTFLSVLFYTYYTQF